MCKNIKGNHHNHVQTTKCSLSLRMQEVREKLKRPNLTSSQSYRSSAAQKTQHSPANSTRDAGYLQTGPTEMCPFICLLFRLDQNWTGVKWQQAQNWTGVKWQQAKLTTIDPLLFLTVIAEMSDHGQPWEESYEQRWKSQIRTGITNHCFANACY